MPNRLSSWKHWGTVSRLAIIVGTGLVITLPCLIYGFPFYGDDSASNLVLCRQFAAQFCSGELYPRWLQGLNGGLGNPTGFYYPPFSYWFTSLLKSLSGSDPISWRQLGVSAVFAVVASGVFAFFWLRRTVSSNVALLAAVVYLILPYHVHTDLYGRGALAELWSFAWMPLILWAVDEIVERKKLGVIWLAVSYSLLVLTHLPTTLIFSLVPVAYSLIASHRHARSRAFQLTVAGMALGMGISSIYLLPALAMQEFIYHTTEGIGGHYYFGNWFLFTNLKWSGPRSEYFWVAIESMFLAALAFIVLRAWMADSQRRKRLFWFGIALSCFFMMTLWSKPIWQLLPALQKTQFPFRLNTTLSIAVTALVAYSFSKAGKARIVFAVAVVLLALTWLYNTGHRAYYSYPVHYIDSDIVEATNKRLEQRRDTNEFRPRWVASITEDELDTLLEEIGQNGNDLKRASVVEGEASVSTLMWAPREILLIVDTPAGATMNVSQFYFPGWMAQFDDAPDWRAVEPSKPGGLIKVSVPPGKHQLRLQLGRRAPEFIGQLISAVSLIILLSLAGVFYKRH